MLPICIFGQGVTISVVDDKTNEPLIGATLEGTVNGVTDVTGRCILLLQADQLPASYVVQYLGYRSSRIKINTGVTTMTVRLDGDVVLETMTITGSKYERRLSESTVSVEVLKPDLIANTNAITIDDALDKVSGVQMVDGQANIRGGSGYSYGAGSRVMLLVDDMPALQTDAGFPNWGDMPVENIDQVEIVKGASSSLYGSAALNGIINIRTGTPTSTPQTMIATSYGRYGQPQDTTKQWWGDTARYTYMLNAVHKQKVGKLDIVGSIFYFNEESYNRATYDDKYRGGLKLKYHLTDKIQIGLNTVVNRGYDGDFFIWADGKSGATSPFPSSSAVKNHLRYFIDPSLTIRTDNGNVHRLLTRYHRIENNNSGNQSNQSSTYYGEYQFQRNIERYDLLITSGLVASATGTDAQLFGDTTFTTKVYAYYAQLEKKIGKVNLSAGARYEYNEQNTPEEFNGLTIPDGRISAGRWVSRAGVSYEYMPYSSIRGSWGQGYRFPTITERFITTTFGIFSIAANPDLVPESGWTAEIGIKQGIQIGGIKGFVDLAAFTSRYQEMMEFTFSFTNFRPSFTSQNVGDTRINGLELSLFATADIGSVTLNAFGGYTFIDPIYTNFEGNTDLQESLSADVNVLKYRAKHNAKIDLEGKWNNWAVGLSYIRSSHVINIDAVLEGRGFEAFQNSDLLGVKDYRARNADGWSRWDIRTSYVYQMLKTSIIISNLTNTEYSVRPALLEAPRTFTIRMDYTIDWRSNQDIYQLPQG